MCCLCVTVRHFKPRGVYFEIQNTGNAMRNEFFCGRSCRYRPNDEYGYGQHDAQSFKFSVESCNEKVPVLLGNAQKKKFTQNDVSLFKVLHEKVMEENNVAKEAYRSGIKLVNMPPKNRARA